MKLSSEKYVYVYFKNMYRYTSKIMQLVSLWKFIINAFRSQIRSLSDFY